MSWCDGAPNELARPNATTASTGVTVNLFVFLDAHRPGPYSPLFADAVAAALAMNAEIQMVVVGVGRIGTWPQDGGKVAAGSEPQGHEQSMVRIAFVSHIRNGNMALID